MSSPRFPNARVFAAVDTAAQQHNFRLLRSHARQTNPQACVIAVVKANAYGHGADLVVPALLAAGCDRFAVATLQEALELRRMTDAEILILGYTPPARAPLLAGHRLTQALLSPDYAKALSKVAVGAGCRVSVQLKLNGGLCRAGADPDDEKGLEEICRQRGLDICGLYTHFPAADTDPVGTKAALTRFLRCKRHLEGLGLSLFCHAAASAAALTLPESVLDGIRPGLALYGIAPVPTALELRPALALYAPIVQIRTVPPATPVGYGGDFVTSRPARIGTLPLGYADGFCRRLCGLSVTVLHGGLRFPAPVVGRVSMDQITLDLTDTPAAVGDTVVLWQSAAIPAAHADTVPYEVLTALSPRVKRIRSDALGHHRKGLP